MFNGFSDGFRKIVGAIGSTENLDDSHQESEVLSTPCINKSKKRKAMEATATAFSSKKKYEKFTMQNS